MSATFRFDINPAWERAIREKKKNIDIRINIKPFADANTGDSIEYRTTKVRIKAIRGYASVADAIAYEDLKRTVPEASDRTEGLHILLDALEHPQDTHGVLAFEIEPV